jgi:hypothetical protein
VSALIVLLLSSQQPALDEGSLQEAVAVYVRDLGFQVQRRSGAPIHISSQALGEVAQLARDENARLAFWCVARRGEVVLYVVDDEAKARALPVSGLKGHALERVLALKIRAVLTGQADREPSEPVPAPLLPPSPSPSPSPLPKAEVAPKVAPRPAPRAAKEAPPKAKEPPYRARVWLASGYRVIVPLEVALVRHNAYLDIAVPWRWMEPHVSAEVGTDPTLRNATGSATLFDVPVRVGLRARLTRGRWTGLLGPVVSLHILHVDGQGSDGKQGDATQLSVGVGLDLGSSVRLSDHVALQVGALFEWLLPTEDFNLHGHTIISVGGAHFGLSAGLAFAAP